MQVPDAHGSDSAGQARGVHSWEPRQHSLPSQGRTTLSDMVKMFQLLKQFTFDQEEVLREISRDLSLKGEQKIQRCETTRPSKPRCQKTARDLRRFP